MWARYQTSWKTRFASPRMASLRTTLDNLLRNKWAGVVVLIGGTAAITLLIAVLNVALVPLPNPGIVYLPLSAMLAYHWGWRYGSTSAALLVLCTYFFFIPPYNAVKPLNEIRSEQLGTLLAITVFVLLLAQLARSRRVLAELEAGRFAALNRVGIAMAGELDEARLLNLIARTARDVTGAQFAAFTLRPVDRFGAPLVPSEGNLFHLAAVVGVTPEQEALLKRMPLGGEGLLAPIFCHGHPVLVDDVLEHTHEFHAGEPWAGREGARAVAGAFARGQASSDDLRSLGVPRGHPIVRSFLGAPLLESKGEVRGGLLLGHVEPGRFTIADQALLVGLASQAAVALENARLYHAAQVQAEELDAVFESIADGISVLNEFGDVVRENAAGHQLRVALARQSGTAEASKAAEVEAVAAARVQAGDANAQLSVEVPGEDGDTQTFAVSAAPMRPLGTRAATASQHVEASPGTVVVWHDVSYARRLLEEQRRHADAEARRALLQAVIDEQPSGVCLVRGLDARLVLCNRAATGVWGAEWQVNDPMHDFLARNGTRILAPDGRELDTNDWATIRTLRTGEGVRHYEEVIKRPDGISLPILFNAVAIDAHTLGLSAPGASRSSEREPAALLVLQDVTALKEAERLKDEFIGIAAHELRNPMAALRGYAEMLAMQTARGKGAQLADWQREAIGAIDQATSRLVDLTDDLLDVTRLQGGRLELRREPADLIALVRRVAGRVRMTAPERPIELETRTEHVVAAIDVARVEQVVTNLLNNAVKYSLDGGQVCVTIEELAGSATARISIRDHGIGIPREQQGRIFGRFERADNAKREGISGTGLGLYLSRELVERHGGRIWFDSEEGRGSTFYVELPTILDDSKPPAAANGHTTSEPARPDGPYSASASAEGGA